MSAVLGLVLGGGLVLMWLSLWPATPAPSVIQPWLTRTQDRLTLAGSPGVTPWGLLATAAALGVVVGAATAAVTGAPVVGVAFGVLASRGPFALVATRARSRQNALREVWPDAVDHLGSGIRAGLALPEALGQLAVRGPEALRAPFGEFARDYRASGRFNDSLDALKARLADPVGDRIVEALRVTREVGGSDVGRLLRTLSQFLREEARLRGELEARQSWIVNAARLAAGAPWAVLALLSTRPTNAAAYNTPEGAFVIALGAVSTVVAYRLMARLGRLPEEPRVLR